MTVRDIVRTDIVTASPDTSAAELARLLDEEKVGSVVITEAQEPTGIVTDRDLAVRVLGRSADPENTTATHVMTPDPVAVDVDAGVFQLTATMCDEAVRRVPVVEDDKLYGIVTLDDLHQLLVSELQNLSGVIEAESPAY